MAADYAADALLERPDGAYRGRAAIEAYFATVPDRLGEARVEFDDVAVEGSTVTFRWHLDGADVALSGTDVCTITDDEIVHQVVRLDAGDF